MVLQIKHKTLYSYEAPVNLEPHYFYLKPHSRPYLNLQDYKLEVTPSPIGLSERLDAESNAYFQMWMNQPTDKLEVQVDIKIMSRPHNQFNFLIYPTIILGKGNFYYAERDQQYLRPYLQHTSSAEVTNFVQSLLNQTNDQAVQFLTLILDEIHKGWDHTIREEENILSTLQCFEQKSGSCRDLSMMLIDMLRSLGLASRFISGYAYNPELVGHDLHAWVEVLLPGAGWVGLDPSLGLFTDEAYIPLACSFDPSFTMPVIGTYRGNVKSTLKTAIVIKKLE